MRVRHVSEALMLGMLPRRAGAVISITEPGRAAVLPKAEEWGALLRVGFADAEYDEAMLARLAARGVVFSPRGLGFPTRESTHAIGGFLCGLRFRTDIDELVVHCHAGRRRSAAVARYAAEVLGWAWADPHDDYNRTVYALLQDPGRFDHVEPARSASWVGAVGAWAMDRVRRLGEIGRASCRERV